MKSDEARCMTCRAAVTILSPVTVALSNGRKAVKGACAKGHTVFRMCKKS